MSRIASNVDSVAENIKKEIEQNTNVCNITKSIDIEPKRMHDEKDRIYSEWDVLANRVIISFFYDRHQILFASCVYEGLAFTRIHN